jgi:hypothetical protein
MGIKVTIIGGRAARPELGRPRPSLDGGDLDQTRAMFREMMEANHDFLPLFAGGGAQASTR